MRATFAMVSIATFATLLVVTAAVTAWKYRGSKGSEGFATAWWHGVVRSPSIDATTRWAASRFAAAEAPCDVVAVRDAALRHCGADPFAVRGDAYVATGCMDPRGMAAVLDADTCMYVGYVSTDKVHLLTNDNNMSRNKR